MFCFNPVGVFCFVFFFGLYGEDFVGMWELEIWLFLMISILWGVDSCLHDYLRELWVLGMFFVSTQLGFLFPFLFVLVVVFFLIWWVIELIVSFFFLPVFSFAVISFHGVKLWPIIRVFAGMLLFRCFSPQFKLYFIYFQVFFCSVQFECKIWPFFLVLNVGIYVTQHLWFVVHVIKVSIFWMCSTIV